MAAAIDAHRVNPDLKTDSLVFEREYSAIFVRSHRAVVAAISEARNRCEPPNVIADRHHAGGRLWVNCRDPALGGEGQLRPSKPTIRQLLQSFPQCHIPTDPLRIGSSIKPCVPFDHLVDACEGRT